MPKYGGVVVPDRSSFKYISLTVSFMCSQTVRRRQQVRTVGGLRPPDDLHGSSNCWDSGPTKKIMDFSLDISLIFWVVMVMLASNLYRQCRARPLPSFFVFSFFVFLIVVTRPSCRSCMQRAVVMI